MKQDKPAKLDTKTQPKRKGWYDATKTIVQQESAMLKIDPDFIDSRNRKSRLEKPVELIDFGESKFDQTINALKKTESSTFSQKAAPRTIKPASKNRTRVQKRP